MTVEEGRGARAWDKAYPGRFRPDAPCTAGSTREDVVEVAEGAGAADGVEEPAPGTAAPACPRSKLN